jgi:hypothetical protein
VTFNDSFRLFNENLSGHLPDQPKFTTATEPADSAGIAGKLLNAERS